jgi:iron complex transport system substrate-binding protein
VRIVTPARAQRAGFSRLLPRSPGIYARAGLRTLIIILVLLLFAAQSATAATPKRVVSLAPSLTEMVYALGAGPALVGVTTVCNYPEAARRLPKVGGMEDGGVDLEKVLSLKPDLVVAIGLYQSSTVEALRRLGLRVEVVPSQTVEDVFAAANRLGVLLGREAEAKRLNADLRRRIDRVRKATAALPKKRRPRVFYQVWDKPLMTATRETLIGRLIELSGGVNVFGDLSGQYVQVSPEAVLKRDPQVILAPTTHASRVDPKVLARTPGLAGVTAVRTGRIYVLDGDPVSRAGPRVAEALELVARAIHPELFK